MLMYRKQEEGNKNQGINIQIPGPILQSLKRMEKWHISLIQEKKKKIMNLHKVVKVKRLSALFYSFVFFLFFLKQTKTEQFEIPVDLAPLEDISTSEEDYESELEEVEENYTPPEFSRNSLEPMGKPFFFNSL